MIRSAFCRSLVVLVSAGALALASSASPPNLEETLSAQYEFVRENPSDPKALNDLGNLLALAEFYPEAETAYRSALNVEPGNVQVRFNLALLLQQVDQNKHAEEELRNLLEIAPEHAWAHYQLGVSLHARDQRKEALEHYARALALNPSLSFAGNNPHIIENQLFSEALLLSQRYRANLATKVPRQYADRARIRNLMLQAEEDPSKMEAVEGMEESGEMEGDDAAYDGTAGAMSGTSGSLRERGQGAPAQVQSREQNSRATSGNRSGGQRSGGAFVGATGTSNADSADNARDAQRVRSRGTTARGNSSTTTSPGARSREPQDRQNDRVQSPPKSDGRSGGGLQRAPSAGARYIPSRGSNARLELQQLPESDDVPTLFSDAAGR